MNLREIRSHVDIRKGARGNVERSLSAFELALVDLNKRQESVDKARAIIQEVAQLTQRELEYHVSELVTLALSSIFDDPYKFHVDFVIKRERTEAELYFERDGERTHPMTAAGGGAVDVAANALRFALWSLKSPKPRNTIVLDEPFKHLSRDMMDRAGVMLKEVSEKLGIQVICVSHAQELIEAADKVFEVTMRDGVSSVKEVVNATKGKDRSAGNNPGTDELDAPTGQSNDEHRPEDGAGVDGRASVAGEHRRRVRGGNDNQKSEHADSEPVQQARVAGVSVRRRRK